MYVSVVSPIRFEWDPSKAASNLRKHAIGFAEACTVFEDDEALLMPDPDHSDTKDRWALLGISAAARVLVVIHCERADGETIRLIAARRADRDERHAYADRSP
jgi:uncharacterized DUF497 family protein